MRRRTKGSGYLRKNPNGSKTLFLSFPDPITGTMHKFQATARSESVCRQLIAEKREQMLKKQALCANSCTVSELCKAYLNYQYEQGMLKPSSRDRNLCTINNQIEHTKLGNMQISMVGPAHIDDHFAALFKEKRLSASTIAKVKHILNSSFRWACLRQSISSNPVEVMIQSIDARLDSLRAKKADDTDVRVLSPDQIMLFTNECQIMCSNGAYRYPQGLCCMLLLETGMRVGELLALRWKDYDPSSGILSINRGRARVREDSACDSSEVKLEYKFIEESTKNQKARNIQLTASARSIMNLIRQSAIGGASPDDYICTTRKGTPLSSSDMDSRINIIFRNAGISKESASGLHILRRTFATYKYRSGWDSAKIAAYIGDLESTVKKSYIADREIHMKDGRPVAVISVPREEL